MKYNRYLLSSVAALALGGLALSGCNYLDVVPDGTATEADAFKNPRAAEGYLYTCYGYLPNPSSTFGIDLMTGDETITAFEHEAWANFAKGSYTAVSPIISYWNDLYTGIRYCYQLIANIESVPNMDPAKVKDYKAQAEFLVGYYHYLLIQNYGAIIIVNGVEDINAPVESFKSRSTVDESVAFVVSQFDKAAADLPNTRSGDELGLVTRPAALALKAKILVIAASPLFNGYDGMKGLANPDGTKLFPQSFDQSKWDKAYQATKEAIQAAESAGYKLYTENTQSNIKEPADPTQKALRMIFFDTANSSEILWGNTEKQYGYDLVSKSAPYVDDGAGNGGNNSYGGVGLTLAMMKRFYTDKGLPLEEDKSFPAEANWWELITNPENPNAEGLIPRFFDHREPRLYAWTTFQNGFYETQGSIPGTQYDPIYHRGIDGAKLLMKFLVGEPSGRGVDKDHLRNNNYSPSGFLNKRHTSPLHQPNDWENPYYIHPFISIADLYLLHAEAAVETGNLPEAKAYLDKIRSRAGIPGVDAAWAQAKNPGKASNKEGMREIVRQERMVEMYLLNQNFWDMRRWLLGEKYFDVQPMGMNSSADNIEEFTRPTVLDFPRSFVAPRNYLMPIPVGEVNKNPNLVQNPGY